MDPDEALRRIRELISHIDSECTRDNGHYQDGCISELVTLIDGLDEWLSKGGFKPRDWA